MTTSTAAEPLPRSEKATRATLGYVDDRFGSAGFLKRNLNKVFPGHWSFMLGEIALYSFIMLLLTGVFLTFFYTASVSQAVYAGTYVPLRGVSMTQAFESTLRISFDVRGGLLIRQIHHWAALLFVASISVHLMRVFFTGAFRKPREVNWFIGSQLLILGILEGFAGYSLPDDLLSGTGLRIAFSIVEAIPVVGTWVAFLLFGGNFPGPDFIPRLFVAHVLLFPGIMLGLITAHLMILWHQKHTDFPGPGKTEHNVIGARVWPTFAGKGLGFQFMVFGVLALLGGFAQINPIWLFGPYSTANVAAGSQPDWYMGWLDGVVRIMPNWEINIAHRYTLSLNLFIPSVIVAGLVFTGLMLWPWIEQRLRGDYAPHNLLERPRDNPWRTGIGAMSLTFYVVLLLAGGNDILATTFHLSIQTLIRSFQVLVIVAPPLAYVIAYRWALALQHRTADVKAHGVETGIIVRTPEGGYYEMHAPYEPPALHGPLVQVDEGEAGDQVALEGGAGRVSVPARRARPEDLLDKAGTGDAAGGGPESSDDNLPRTLSRH